MAPTTPPAGAGDTSPTGTGPAANPKARKRTKTGCLTCRKRRIKCGEERPTCANCIKSKRQCEGYNQRVVFKPPIGDWPNRPGVVSTLQYHNSMLPGTRATNYAAAQPSSQPPETAPTSIQPRPLTQFEYSSESAPTLAHLNTQQAYSGIAQPYGQDGNFTQSLASPQRQHALQSPQHQLPTPTSATPYFAQPSPVHASFQGQYAQDPARYSPNQYPAPQPSDDQKYYSYGSHSHAPLQSPQVTSASFSQSDAYALAVSQAGSSHSSFSSVQIPQHDVSADVQYMPQHAVYEPPAADARAPEDQAHIPLHGFGGEDHVSPTQVLDEAAVEDVDDLYWDVDSDEEMINTPDAPDEDATVLSRDFSLIRRIHHENTNQLTIRRYDAFMHDGILTHYKAEHVANPLKNPKTARVFAHFIHVTGPSLSFYERNPRNASIFDGEIPPSQQNLSTYILPLKALNNQGLLHAMLALASLHIARLQRASVTPSYKHYAYALKRLGRSLSNPQRRHTIATIATSLLLAYYEVMTAEHVKWSTHLVGAAQLIAELDFPTLTREARRLKAAQTAQESEIPYAVQLGSAAQEQYDRRMEASMMTLDEDLIGMIVGRKVSYDDFDRVLEYGDQREEKRSPQLELGKFETLQDLQWWNCRHDAFQSMVSGNPLITPFRKWTDCPPRAPFNRADALYGTHDHVILLIARIADFAVRDRSRKLKQVEANGGQWRPTPNMPGGMPMGPPPPKGPGGQQPAGSKSTGPPPHMQGPGPPTFGPPPGQGQGPGPTQGQPPRGPPQGGMPAFYGMAPTLGTTPLPRSYAAPDGYTYKKSPQMPNIPNPKFADLPAALARAEEEWDDISRAHSTMESILSSNEAFAPLTEDLYPVALGGNMTPFGSALVHRSYNISTLWTMLYLAKILLVRSHPAMPPAATIAAGVAASTTKPYAMLIGRITAGMQVPASDDIPLSPFLGAALTEATMALFFAGVQYQEPAQRGWLIKRLLDTERRTGWASALAIARSCETSWEKAAEMGSGPPWKRRTRRFGEEGPIVIDGEGGEGGWGGGGVVRAMEGASAGASDQRYVVRSIKVPWAKNLLASEEELRVDMERVELGGGER